MDCYVASLQEIDRTLVEEVGGKAAHLGELSKIEGIRVPPGFCVKTNAFRRMMAEVPEIRRQLDELARARSEDSVDTRDLSRGLRQTVEQLAIPGEVEAAITRAVEELDESAAYAVRSSATAEDSAAASFAGQQDTYLNVLGTAAVLQSARRCWASLFSERAVGYRIRNGVDHRTVEMAVVVQRMLFPDAAGVLFTADPVTGHRKVSSIETSFGLGEVIVGGLVEADTFKVCGGEIVQKTIGAKAFEIRPSTGGGTERQALRPSLQGRAALTDPQVLRLAQMGRRIEAHFGCPQDIEWCLVGEEFHFVQSRPITTLFPVPTMTDGGKHVYISVGHQQMMTDAMKPLGWSLHQLTAAVPMHEAGGRLFVDIAPRLASPATRAAVVSMLAKSDPLLGDALERLLQRRDYLQPQSPTAGSVPAGGAAAPIETDPSIVTRLVARNEASLATLKRDIQTKAGPSLFDFICEDIKELRRVLLDPLTHQVIMAGMEATWWLNDHLQMWLGEKNAADTLTLSAPNNVTSEMGLALQEVADVIRPHREVIAFLQHIDDREFLEKLPRFPGGWDARDAIQGWLDRYGMRGAGEIDITRPRWSERPLTLVPLILGNIRNFEPGAGRRRFEQGLEEARKKEQDLLRRLRALPGGRKKADEVKRNIDRLRTFIGYREYPKYGIVSRTFVYKQALLREAKRLVQANVLRDAEDVFYLTFQEFHAAVRTGRVDDQLIRRRKVAFKINQSLTPPRLFTSDGEIITGRYHRDALPPGALPGLPVSRGVVEGRARVVLEMTEAHLEHGEILVTPHTDPSWTPLFVTIAGLVTEVGGLMTHGAVIAREYGVPAIVGVEHATRLIRDGQRIRVHGTEGYVEILA